MAFNPELMYDRMVWNRAVMTGAIDPDTLVGRQLEATLAQTLQDGQGMLDGASALSREAMQRVTGVAQMLNAMDPLAEAKGLRDRLAEVIPIGEERIRKQKEAIGLGQKEADTGRRRVVDLQSEVAGLQNVVNLQRKARHPVYQDFVNPLGDKISSCCGGLGDLSS